MEPFCSAQVNCNGVVSGNITSGVTCSRGGDCILDGATISGNVQCSSGTLLAKGNSFISGNVLLSGSITRAELDAVTVLGVVDVKEASSLVELVIKNTATLGSVIIENVPGDVVVAGSLTGLEISGSGNLFANNLSSDAIILVKGGNGIIELCGSFLGGLLVEERTGDVEVNANNANCNPTTLDRGFTANKGSGRVRLIGAILSSGDFIVSEYNGNVTLQEAQVSDVKVAKNNGSLTIHDIFADSDMTITEHVGSVTIHNVLAVSDISITGQVGSLTIRNVLAVSDTAITGHVDTLTILNVFADGDTVITGQVGNVVVRNLTTKGDFAIKEVQGNVTLRDSNFTLEDISIVLVSGAVTVQNNTELSLTVEEIGGMVQIIDNVIVDGSVNKNSGGVSFFGNVFESLSCSDNNPAPSGIGNTISFPIGQCATGL